ncbi:MAG TPA: endonuclease/exonuclease/phosphatase family protein [Limnochordia bacterium]
MIGRQARGTRGEVAIAFATAAVCAGAYCYLLSIHGAPRPVLTEPVWSGWLAPAATLAADRDGDAKGEAMRTIRIVSFNIQHGAGLDGVVDIERTAAALRELRPDVVFLTEVDAYWPRSGGVHQVLELAARLDLPFQYYIPALHRFRFLDPATPHVSYYGNAFLTRYPARSFAAYPLPRRGLSEPRNVLVASLDVGGGGLTVAGTHLGLDRRERMDQVAALLELTRKLPEDRVLVGDFNAHPTDPEIQALLSLWVDAWDGTGRVETFPSEPARHRIDYAFVGPALRSSVLAYDTPAVTASDHRPVLLVLQHPAVEQAH